MYRKFKSLFNKISRQFLVYYFLAFVLSALCIFIIFLGAGKHISSKFYSGIYNNDNIRTYVNEHTLKELYDKYKLPEGSSITLINNNNEVIETYKSDKPIGYIYDWDEIDDIYSDELVIVYSLNAGRLLFITMGDDRYIISEQYFVTLYILMFLSILLSLCLIIIFFSRVSAKMVVKPINQLATGVDNIKMGNYSSRIKFKSRNELGQLKESINEMTETIEKEISLREKAEANRKRLILDISHDLKTPLTNILGYSETLLSCEDMDADSKQSLSIIVSNSKKANNLLSDLVDLSQLDLTNNINFEEQDLCEFVRELVIDYIPELEAKHIEYHIDIPDTKFFVYMNKIKLNRAISNIINNSIKYVTINPTIDISIHPRNKKILLTLTDNGDGIPKDFTEDIFEPFVRLDSSRNSNTGGTGLGLSISKAIIELHKGHIYIDTSYDGGTRIVIELPLIK